MKTETHLILAEDDRELIQHLQEALLESKMSSEKRWVREVRAAEYIGCSLTSIRRMKKEGAIPYHSWRGMILFDLNDFDSEIAKTRVPANPYRVKPIRKKVTE